MIYCLAHIRTQQKIIVTFVIFMAMHACLVAFQLCLILCDPMDCSPPGFLFMSFSRQEYWSGFTCPSPGDHPDPGIKPASYITFTSPALAGRFLPLVTRAPVFMVIVIEIQMIYPSITP